MLDGPDPVVLPSASLGASSLSDEVVLRNGSRGPITFTASVTGPFEVVASGELAAGATAPLRLTFRPVEVGPARGTVTVVVEQSQLVAGVQAQGNPPCVSSSPCQAPEVDPATGACLAREISDGAPCSDACIGAGVCIRGECRGTLVDCSDGNACTRDFCSPQGGCGHVAEACGDAEDPCHAASCDPTTGCTVTAVADGTRCGGNDCTTAHICVAGACVERAPPEGSECGDPSPCQPFGVCTKGACVRAAPTRLRHAWTYAVTDRSKSLSILLADDRSVYFIEETFPPSGIGHRTAVLVALDGATGAVRYRQPLPAWMRHHTGPSLGGGLFFDRTYDEVAAYETATGAQRWRLDLLPVLRPHFSPAPEGYVRLVVWPRLVRREGPHVVVFANASANGPFRSDPIGAFRVTLDPATGAVRSVIKLGEQMQPAYWDGADPPRLDARGNMYALVDDSLRSLDALGRERWRTQLLSEYDGLGPTLGSRMFTWRRNSALFYERDAATGVTRPDPYDSGLKSYRHFVGRGDDAFFEGTETSVNRLDLRFGTWTATRWMYRPHRRSALVLGSKGQVLFSAAHGAHVAGGWAIQYAGLFGAGRDGTRFQCELAERCDADDDPVLVQERWIELEQTPDRIVAHEVPGLSVSRWGWVTRHGSFARDFAELP